jgi:hemerythrin superfamily protein
MDATELLKNDHAFVKMLFKNYQEMEPGDAGRKKTLFRQIRVELEAHSEIEEKIFYPAVRDARTPEAERLVREAYEEHRLVKQLLRELSKGKPGSEEFDAKFKVLKENVLHHAKEEESDLFAVAREALSAEDLEQLGKEMAARKHELGGRLHPVEPLARKARRVVSRVRRAIGLSTPGPRRRRS